MKVVIGILIGLGIGAACRWFDVPLPSPPKLIGAILVVAMTLGYILTDHYLSRGPQPPAEAAQPTGPTGGP
jgi:XapX domain-containing protein